MIKTRKVTKTETYTICDLCGKEVDDRMGNNLENGEVTYLIHRDIGGCAEKLLIEAVKKNLK